MRGSQTRTDARPKFSRQHSRSQDAPPSRAELLILDDFGAPIPARSGASWVLAGAARRVEHQRMLPDPHRYGERCGLTGAAADEEGYED